MLPIIYVGIGGCLGAISRYLSGIFVSELAKNFVIPLQTFSVNMLGTLIMGFSATILTKSIPIHTNLRYFLLVGFLGSYTTFSSYMLEAIRLVNSTNAKVTFIHFLIYTFGQIVLGFVFISLGVWLAQKLMG